MISDVQTVTIHHPQKTNGHLHPSAPPITVMTSAEGRQAKKEWWPTAVDLLDICVCVCTCGVRQVFNLLLYSAVTQWFHNLRDSSPQNLKMSAFSSVWWNWAAQVMVFKTSKKTQLCLFREITTWFLEIIHRPWTIFRIVAQTEACIYSSSLLPGCKSNCQSEMTFIWSMPCDNIWEVWKKLNQELASLVDGSLYAAPKIWVIIWV